MNALKELSREVLSRGLCALIIDGPSRLNRRRLTGFRSSGGVLLIDGEENAFLIIDSRYHELAAENAEGAGYELIPVEFPADCDSALRELVRKKGFKRIGFEAELTSVSRLESLSILLERELIPTRGIVEAVREVKTPEEISCIIRAQRITERALTETLDYIRPGRTEREIAARLSSKMFEAGAEALSFNVFCLAGANAARPHGVTGDRPVREGETLLIDMGAVWGGCYADMSRTFAVGHINEETERIYYAVLDAQNAAIAAARPGMTGGELEAVARGVLSKQGLDKYFTHLLGHGVGLSVAEAPFTDRDCVLKAGSVLSQEPGVYIPGRLGVRIEDLIVLREGGAENLTAFPKALTVL